MLIGYARVSTADQNSELQIDALIKAGCDQVFTDEGVSGSKTSRPELGKALDHLRSGDSLVVWKLDRLGRSLPHLLEVVGDLEQRGIQFKSLQETIDTSTPGGKLVFHVFCSLAEFERDLIKERTNAGLAAARARGRNGGRPSVLTPEQVKMGKALAQNREIPIGEICKQLRCSRATYYRQVAPLLKPAA
jgi:DNA invertase Pin-like site-specific DNA recombinase